MQEMDAVIKKHKAEEKEKKRIAEERKKAKIVKETISIEDLKKLIVDINAKQQSAAGPAADPKIEFSQQPMTQQQQKKQPTREQQIAYQLWKDSKATSIVCLIAIVMPMIAVLVTMFPGGAMFALVVAMCGIIYPCIVLVKMIGLQMRAYKKYGLKPLLMFRSQQQPVIPYHMQAGVPPNQNKPEFF